MQNTQTHVSPVKAAFSKIFKIREINILLPLIAIMVVTTIINPVFMRWENIVELLKNISLDLIVAVAMTYMLISGNLDLSIGAVITLSGITAGFCMVNGVPIPLSILAGLALACGVGMFNGLLVVKLNIPSVITTLGTMYICKGLILIISNGRNISPLPESFTNLVQGEFLGISYAVYMALFAVIIFNYVLKHTTYGRSILAVGGNAEATKIAGININTLRVSIYCLLSTMAGVSGILIASRLGTAVPNAGEGKELSIVAGVIIGGTSIFGGVGSVIGTVIGISIMEVMTNALVMLRVSAYYQNVFIGAIMLLAVGFDSLRNMGVGRRKRS